MASNSGLFYHQEVPATVRIAQVVGLSAAGFMTGGSGAMSYLLIPSLLEAPAPLLARQWRKAYNIGRVIHPVLGVAGTLSLGWLASREPYSTSAFRFYTTSAVLIPSMVLYTLGVMKPVDDKLLSKAESLASAEITDKAAEAGVAQEETTHALVDRWGMLNLGRTLVAGVSTVCAIWATLTRIDVVGFEKLGLTSGANRLG